jgi:hypothetical protein
VLIFEEQIETARDTKIEEAIATVKRIIAEFELTSLDVFGNVEKTK